MMLKTEVFMSIHKRLIGAVCAAALCFQASTVLSGAQTTAFADNTAVISIDSGETQQEADLTALGLDEDYAQRYLADEDICDDPTYMKIVNGSGKVGLTDFTSLISHQARFSEIGKIYGIDVSVYNGDIDFEKVKKEGYKFVIVRAGARGYASAGTIVEDSRFEEHVDNAHKAGLMVGAYFYTQAVNKTEVKQEADITLKKIAGRTLELPVYFDIEPAYNANGLPGRLVAAKLSKAQKAELCDYFCTYIKNRGYDAGVTSCMSWFLTDINMSSLENKHDIWLAHYTTNTTYTGDFNMWQFASTRKVTGVTSSCTDQDVRYTDLIKPYGSHGLTASTNEKSVVLKWNATANTKGYIVYKKDSSGKVTKLATTKALTYTATRELGDIEYYVRSYNEYEGKTYYSANSNTVKISTLAAAKNEPAVPAAEKVVISGKTRYDTAVEISKAAYPGGCYSVVLTAGEGFADSLASVPLAQSLTAPILITEKNKITAQTLKEIQRLNAKSIFIVGGTSAVSKTVEDQLKAKGYNVWRIKGTTRYETAATVATNTDFVRKTSPKEIFFVSGEKYADSLSVGSIATARGAVVLYMNKEGTLDKSTKAYLDAIKDGIKSIYIVGGSAAIGTKAETTLKSYAKKITRISGKDRYATCLKLSQTFAKNVSGKEVCTTTGQNFPDALSGGVFAVKQGAAIVIADKGHLDALNSYRIQQKTEKIYIFGGNTKNIIV